MEDQKKIPAVRFKGFGDEWVVKKVGDVLIERNVLQKISDSAPILAFASGQGVIDRSERKSNNRDHLTLDQANKIYKLTEYDDIVYNPSNLKYGAIDRNKHGRGVISPIYVTFVTEENSSFIEPIVRSEKFKLKALSFEEGTVVKRQSVKPENLLSLDICMTKIPDEQSKIGAYFENLEEMIRLHQRKHAKLVTLKKAMLKKMFPAPGTAIPEIRFKGFSTSWKERTVGSLLVERNFQAPKNEKYPLMSFIAHAGVAKKGARYNREFLVTDEANKKYKQTEFGDFIYSSNNLETGSIGLNNYGCASISPVYSIFQPTEQGVSSFIGRLLVRKEVIDQMVRWRQGVVYGQWRIHEADFLKVEVHFPSIPEQKKIGAYFRHLDDLIAQYAEQGSKLKQLKTACLEKMFV